MTTLWSRNPSRPDGELLHRSAIRDEVLLPHGVAFATIHSRSGTGRPGAAGHGSPKARARERARKPLPTARAPRTHCKIGLALSSALDILANPFIAVVLGLLAAAGLLAASRASFKRIRPETAPADIALAALSLFARLAAATIAMWAYKRFATPGFKPFALSLAGGFVLLYTIEIVRYAGLGKYRRPVGAERK